MALAGAFLWRFWPQRARGALLAAVAIYFLIGAGLVESATVALFFMASRETGVFVLAALGSRQRGGFELSRPVTIGLALYLSLFGAMVHDNLNYNSVFLGLMVAPFLARLALWRRLGVWRGEWEAIARTGVALERIPYAPLVVAVIVIGFVARFGFLPTVGADDNVFHLSVSAK